MIRTDPNRTYMMDGGMKCRGGGGGRGGESVQNKDRS